MEGVIDVKQVVQNYLKILRLDEDPPTLNFLQRLIQHHLSIVPYETFSKFYYATKGDDYIPSLSTFVENLQNKGWGGTCFTLNINFARLLQHLGFECALVRVHPGHIAIMVTIGERQFYIDVGYGAPIMKPVELAAKNRHVLHGFGEEIVFTKKSKDGYEIDRRSNGKSFVKKEIEWRPLTEKDIDADILESYEDSDQNITMRRIQAVRFHGHECYFLRNRVMKVMTLRHISEYQMRDWDKWRKTVQDVYHLDPTSLRESVQFLAERGVHLFDHF